MQISLSLKKILIKLGLIYLALLLAGAVIFFNYLPAEEVEEDQVYSWQELTSSRSRGENVVLLEDPEKAARARIDILAGAEESLDIAYFSLYHDEAGEVFLGKLLEAADRGVEVRLLLDGFFNVIRRGTHSALSLLGEHENIELKIYEPLPLTRPWYINNRMHDKIILADGDRVITGGRNIGNKYFDEDHPQASRDRDIMIIGGDDSVLNQFKSYFGELWQLEYNEKVGPELDFFSRWRAERREDEIRATLSEMREDRSDLFQAGMDWAELAHPVNNIELISNGLRRLQKEPVVWKQLVELLQTARSSVRLQTPYLTPTEEMLQHLEFDEIRAEELEIITNSVEGNPNPLAAAGYRIMRPHIEEVLQSGGALREYEGHASLHAKSYIFDDRLSLIGSFNLVHRSAYFSTESLVAIDSPELAAELEHNFVGLMEAGSDDPGDELSSPLMLLRRGIRLVLGLVLRNFLHML